jgi:hypothetical protein
MEIAKPLSPRKDSNERPISTMDTMTQMSHFNRNTPRRQVPPIVDRKDMAIKSFERPHFTSHNPLTNPIGETDNRYILKQKELFLRQLKGTSN